MRVLCCLAGSLDGCCYLDEVDRTLLCGGTLTPAGGASASAEPCVVKDSRVHFGDVATTDTTAAMAQPPAEPMEVAVETAVAPEAAAAPAGGFEVGCRSSDSPRRMWLTWHAR